MTSTRLTDDIKAILHQGGDPSAYRDGLASLRHVSLAEVDLAIAAVPGTPLDVHPKDLAQERLAEDRRASARSSEAWREANHEA